MNCKKITFLFAVALFVLMPFAFASQTNAQTPNKRARNLAKQGDQLYNRRRYQEALQKYAEAIRIAPVFPKARFFKGYSHYHLEQYSDAVTELNFALDQGYPPLDVVSIRMEANFGNQNYAGALEDANRAIGLAPNVAYYHAFLGRIQIINGEFGSAIQSLNKAIELNDKSADVNYFMAVAHGGNGNFVEQGVWAEKALQRGTAFGGDSWYLVGDSQYRQREYEKAVQSFKNAINAYKNDISTGRVGPQTNDNLHQSYLDLSDVYRNLNRYEDAVETAQEGLSNRPNDADLHISLAWYYSLSGKFANAIVAGEKAVTLGPAKYMAHTNLCRAYLDEGEYYTLEAKDDAKAKVSFNKSITQCKRALELQKNDGETLYYLGRANQYLANRALSDSFYKQSVPGLEKFTKENPNYSDGFYLLGNAYYATGQSKKAIDSYKECLRISPRFARVHYNLGYVLADIGQMAAAREQYNKLLELDPALAKKLSERLK